jgi:hypothetical protein
MVKPWLSGITNMVKTPAIYRLSPIYRFWHFWCDFCNFCVFFSFFCVFWVHFFCIFYVFNNEDFWCAFFFDFLWFFFIFCVHFLHFLLPPIVKVDISSVTSWTTLNEIWRAMGRRMGRKTTQGTHTRVS